MAKKITSYEGLFGNTIYRDEHGKKIGESRLSFFGGTNLYDAKGHKVGYSMTGMLGGENHYDNHGHKVGYYSWFCIDGSWFQKVNLNMPERCGFFPRKAVADYLSNPDEHDLDMETMLSIENYQALEAEVKKAYQYFEYTSSWSSSSIRAERSCS